MAIKPHKAEAVETVSATYSWQEPTKSSSANEHALLDSGSFQTATSACAPSLAEDPFQLGSVVGRGTAPSD